MGEGDQLCRAEIADRQQWTEAFAAYERAEAAYRPIRHAFERMERHRCAFATLRGEVSEREVTQLKREIEWEEISADEGRYLRLHCAALRTVLATPAPNLAAVVCKLELIRDHGWDEDLDPIILADLKRLQARCDGEGRQP